MKALFSNGESEDLTPYIRVARMEIDFENYVMAYYRFIMELPPALLVKIQSDRNKVVFSYKIIYAGEDVEDRRLIKTFQEQIILKPIMDLNTPIDYSDDILRDEEDNRLKLIRYEFIAVSEEVIKTNKPVVSGIYRNVTVDEAVLNMLGLFNNRKIYYKPSENRRKYKQLILSPGNVYTNLKYIDRVYGIYSSGIKIFNHDSGLNILPVEGMDPKAVGSINIEIKFGDNRNNHMPIETSSYDEVDDKTKVTNKVITTHINNVTVSDNSKLSNEIVGTDNYYFGMRDDGQFIKKYSTEVEDRNGHFSKIKTMEDVYDNNYAISSELSKGRKSEIVKLTLSHVDITLEDTFKQFKLNFNNNYYDYFSGTYEIVSLKQEIMVNDSENSMINHIILRRKNPNT